MSLAIFLAQNTFGMTDGMFLHLGGPVADFSPRQSLCVLYNSVKWRSECPREMIHPQGKGKPSPGKQESARLSSLCEPDRRGRVVVVGLLRLLACWVLIVGAAHYKDIMGLLLISCLLLCPWRLHRGTLYKEWCVFLFPKCLPYRYMALNQVWSDAPAMPPSSRVPH